MKRLWDALCFAFFAFGAVMEMKHVRDNMTDPERGDLLEMIGPSIMALGLLYMASEAWEGQWP